MDMAEIIVTGGAGFIGSHLVDHLIDQDHNVIVVDDLSSGSTDNLSQWIGDERLRFVRWDITGPLDGCEELASFGGIDCIFHLAARIDVITSFDEPLDDARRNYIGTLNVLEFAREHGCKQVIFSSSAAVFEDNGIVPIDEDFPKRPLSPYGFHKLMSEGLLSLYGDHHDMRNASFRFFNVYGPRQDPTNPYSGVISKFIQMCIDRKRLIIFGDGEQTRDFIFVKDVVRALVRGYEKGAVGQFNVGTGNETAINELASIVADGFDIEPDVDHRGERRGEIRRSCADIGRMRGELGITPEIPLADGIRDTIGWYVGDIRTQGGES